MTQITAAMQFIASLGAVTIASTTAVLAGEDPPWLSLAHKGAEWICHEIYGENFPSDEKRSAAMKACSVAQHPMAWLQHHEPERLKEWLEQHAPAVQGWITEQGRPSCDSPHKSYDSVQGRCVFDLGTSVPSIYSDPSLICTLSNQLYDSVQGRCIDIAQQAIRLSPSLGCALSGQQYDNSLGKCVSNTPLASPAPWLQCNLLTQHYDGSRCVGN